MQKIIMSALLLAACLSASAQRESLASSMPFFEKKAVEYQHWLDMKGFGEVLQVEQVRLKIDRNRNLDSTELELFLLLRSTDVDTAIAKWNRLKKDFDTDADSLEAMLYRAFIHIMEIPDAQGNIQIYVRNRSASYIKDTHIWIWLENGRIATQKKVATMRAKSFEISVPYPVKKTGKSASSKISAARRRSADEVFDLILKHVKTSMLEHARYRSELSDRKPHIESDSSRTATMLKFTVADLGKEVLSDQNRYFWESWVGINTIAMERLSFQFEYVPAADGGYSLKCIIDGKFGSGVFKPRTSGYMNMEPDFDDFFEKYKNDFRLRIKTLLQKKP
ncbi:MAG: hypothetical protein R2791_22165 [Saprospiraceae bacterium]